jgi:Membrane domain of glycerophosphoryl diester phosphodiesterase
MAFTSLRPLSVGEILDVSFALYRRHFATLGTIAVLCSGLPVLLSLYIEASGGVLFNLPLALMHYVIFTVLSSIATAATVFVVSESYLGRPLAAKDALRRATPLLSRLILCSLLFAIVVGMGFVMFFIPGIVLLCGLLLAFPSLVLEPGNSPTHALSRSWALTKGSRWRMFGLLVTMALLLYVPLIGLSTVARVMMPVGAVGLPEGTLTLAVVGVVQMLLYPLFYCVLTVAYYDLRVRKEGFDLEVLAANLQPA